MKIEFESSIRRLSFLCHLPDIKIAWIYPLQERNVDKDIKVPVFKAVHGSHNTNQSRVQRSQDPRNFEEVYYFTF